MNINLKIAIVCSVVMIVIVSLILLGIYVFNYVKFDYCKTNGEAKKIFEERIEYITTLLENVNIVRLKEDYADDTNNYYSQGYNILGDNEEMTITMICNHNALEYHFSWVKYGENENFVYTKKEIDTVAKILNSISKKTFSMEEIEDFIIAEEDKYSPEKYGLTPIKYAILHKIKYINAFTRDAAFVQTVWKEDDAEKYSSVFSIGGKFAKISNL